MQQVQTTKDQPPASLDEQVEQARAQLGKLKRAADDAQADAERWQTTFEREPTPQAHTSAAVALQKARNARATMDSFESDTLAPLITKQREAANAVEREELRGKIAWSHAETQVARIESAIRACDSEMEAGVRELGAFLLLRHQHAGRANSLGLQVMPASLERLIQGISERLARGKQFGGQPAVHLQFFDQGPELGCKLEINFATNINRLVR